MYAVGASTLRVRLTPLADDEFAVVVADETGVLVAQAQSLTLRAISSEQLHQAAATGRDRSLLTVQWVPVTVPPAAGTDMDVAVVGGQGLGLRAGLEAAGCQVAVYQDLAGLREAAAAGGPLPRAVFIDAGSGVDEGDAIGDALAERTFTSAKPFQPTIAEHLPTLG